MLSVAVAASPERCVAALQSARRGRGSVVSVAAHMEVLEDNGDMQVGRGLQLILARRCHGCPGLDWVWVHACLLACALLTCARVSLRGCVPCARVDACVVV